MSRFWIKPAAAGLAVSVGYLTSQAPVALESKKSTPGVYVWGRTGSVSLATPQRIAYFDNWTFQDVASDSTGHLFAFVSSKGNVVCWDPDRGYPKPVLDGHNITQVRISNGLLYGLSRSGKLYSWEPGLSGGTGGRGWFNWLWGGTPTVAGISELTALANLGWWEKVIQIETGTDHIVALTNKGRVFSGSTGLKRPAESRGQFGIASLSQFSAAPQPGVLHQVVLLKDTPIAQIAAGNNHTLALSKKGEVFGFGENVYGQLGTAVSARTSNIAVPERIAQSIKSVRSVHAGGDISYVTVGVPGDTTKPKSLEYYAFGNGLTGQLGTGLFAHAQSKPVPVKPLQELQEYSEKTKQAVQIPLTALSVSATHTAATLAGSDVLIWGSNLFSQLGNGKRNSLPVPSTIPPLDVSRDQKPLPQVPLKLGSAGKSKQQVYAGNGVTIVYSKR